MMSRLFGRPCRKSPSCALTPLDAPSERDEYQLEWCALSISGSNLLFACDAVIAPMLMNDPSETELRSAPRLHAIIIRRAFLRLSASVLQPLR